jgi:hypothetical protein
MTSKKLRASWGALLLVGLVLEGVTCLNKATNETLSEVVEDADRDLPVLPLAIGVIAGHWFPSARGLSLLGIGGIIGSLVWPIGGKFKK